MLSSIFWQVLSMQTVWTGAVCFRMEEVNTCTPNGFLIFCSVPYWCLLMQVTAAPLFPLHVRQRTFALQLWEAGWAPSHCSVSQGNPAVPVPAAALYQGEMLRSIWAFGSGLWYRTPVCTCAKSSQNNTWTKSTHCLSFCTHLHNRASHRALKATDLSQWRNHFCTRLAAMRLGAYRSWADVWSCAGIMRASPTTPDDL